MSQDRLLLLLLKADLAADVAAVVLFVGAYSYLAKWWANPVGRTLVILDIEVGLGLVPSK